ncbi:hypothetical protein [Coprococcus eutactus]|uniref:hypothetical protein n=1 Tax=Coprococcus eutactus TaxID=33043 RepID=UPI00015E6256|nr:hypothetical protein [Coprococcus eutactus]EDP26735.1 hypothetical protein COPEUT_01213 [Coprococcus eutactus ATCC 27759]UEA78592.1 hypothetical protein LK421_07130 [Coprococcus eutactus ATCC 27759]UWP17022.1 hypothetical protein NQ536_13435 [Coprococcus eutactus]
MQLHTLISSENGPIILWVMYPHRGDELEHTADSIREQVGVEQFTLVAIQVDDWNRDLSPWRSDDVGRILRTFKIKKNVEVTDNGKDNF